MVAYNDSALDTAIQVTSKDWLEDIKRNWSKSPDPALSIIETDFVKFNPLKDPYAIVWFSDCAERPDEYINFVIRLLKRLKLVKTYSNI